MHILQAVSGFTSVHLAYLYKVKKKKKKEKLSYHLYTLLTRSTVPCTIGYIFSKNI